jgi:hexosaminidase
MPRMDAPLLAPVPRALDRTGGRLRLRDDCAIVLFEGAADHVTGARMLQDALERYAGVRWEVRAASSVPGREGVVAALDPKAVPRREGYHLTVGDERIGIVARDAAGLQHAFATLAQLVRQYGRALPCLRIEDHPEFRDRGVMLDISRDRVPAMDTLLALVDMLAGWKVNQLQLYMEHTFAYERHRAVWKDASPLTGEEVLQLDAYCRDRNIELVPNQNSFGHMARWLTKKPYNDLAEAPRGARTAAGRLPPFTLDPNDPRSLALLDGLYAELLPHFASRRVNVGCDETFDLGLGKSKEECEGRGVGAVYLDFVLKVHELCRRHARAMMMWGDIVVRHPDLIPRLPRDVTVLEWGYEHDHPYDTDGRAFRDARVPFYVCPGAGGWNSFIGRTDNAVANIRNAATNGRRYGAAGLLNTEWGDNGHMQPLPVAYLGFLYGASMAWSPKQSADMPLADALSLHAFDDPTGHTGGAVHDLGNAYTVNGAKTRNGSLLAQLCFLPVSSDWPMHRARPGGFDDTRDYLAATIARLDPARMRRPDAALIAEEFAVATRLADAGAIIGAAKQARASGASPSRVSAGFRRAARQVESAVPAYERAWLARSRPGGLADSTKRLRSLAKALRDAAG